MDTFDRAAAEAALTDFDTDQDDYPAELANHLALGKALRAALAEIDRLTRDMPTTDELEALDYAIRVPLSEAQIDFKPFWKLVRAIQDSVVAAGWRPPRGPITNEMVDAARLAYWHTPEIEPTKSMRAALEAAEAKR